MVLVDNDESKMVYYSFSAVLLWGDFNNVLSFVKKLSASKVLRYAWLEVNVIRIPTLGLLRT